MRIPLEVGTPSISCHRGPTHLDAVVDRPEEDSEEEANETDEDEESDEDTQSDESEETKETEQERRVRKANENRKALEQGYHAKDYRLNQPQIASFFHGLRSVPRLWLDRCDDFPRLRFCNACNDIFAYSIAKVPFTHLTTLNIRCMYISGGRLQRFIKQQAHTLENICIDSTTLTDGSWKNVARVLKKVSSLEQLFLRGRLRQKTNAIPTTHRRPRAYKGGSEYHVF